MPKRYMSYSEIAQYLGISTGPLASYKLPEPDVIIGRTRGWDSKKIEEWNTSRPGHGGRPKKEQ
ncbi:hypothetical protein QP104_07265 [Alloscardovia omnicolens]|uniref:hypothetical protein n=1 Tax=Alloscardovia omnicolens TaxID=419015 RepID=UPI00254C937D|nr:hypothetical protein [Alloscardovia omnicolens]MDK6445712.1 hypothetical protein [Alloscardovia omnicolens]